ncbi:MAG: hypothetical protein QGI24_02565 [Kiritimatiellia bacterium]|nr:hypothetical protein [Kiritimatiellia bacterium]MDP6847646.1 hypothetical protein [Kiritimatiellia bacterium]
MSRVRIVTASVLTLLIFGVGLAHPAPAAKNSPVGGAFEIPAWIFDKGNARVIANPDMYADYRDTYPELVVTAGDEMPWVVEHELDFPVDATYTLHIRYASNESRPLELWFDGKKIGECCTAATLTTEPHPYLTANPHFKPPKGARVRRGARWEEAAKLTIISGKHTLKLTCNGPVPNVLALRLESPVAFPKDWKMMGLGVVLSQRQVAERYRYRTRHELGWPNAVLMEKINRLPPSYRTAFLPPNNVNVATLKLAIADTVFRYGATYPNGLQYLERLVTLVRKQADVRDTAPDQVLEIEDALQSLRREALLTHPLLDFDKLLFVKRHPLRSGHIYEDHCAGGTMGGNLCVLSELSQNGKITELVPELSGGLFAQFDLSFDANKVVFAYKKGGREPYRIYEIDIDPATGLRTGGDDFRQLTFNAPDEAELKQRYEGTHWGRGFDDVFPCYLPNGKIMFASSRSKRSVFCAPVTVTTLHIMDADGKNIRCLSEGPVTEIAPRVMDDGRVIYMRWEYVDKGFGNLQSLWSMRPDGSHSAHVYKNDIVLPAGMVDARSIPGSSRIVTVGAPHCGMSVGPVILVDNRLDRRTAVSMTNITPELGYPGMVAHRSGRSFGYFKEPYPLSEKIFVVSHSPGGQKGNSQSYGLYMLDAWGNRAEFYSDPEISCFQPTPLRLRRRPMAVSSVEKYDAKSQKLGTIFMQDVYRGMTGIERGKVKYLRVMEAIGISWDEGFRSSRQRDGAGLQASAVSLKADVNIKKIHGIATVHDDGSACFTVPAEKNIYFQALDENYMELQRMRTFVNLMPGEKRSCIGCHERRQLAPSLASGVPLAHEHEVEALRPQPGDSKPRTVHYATDIRPLWDNNCVGCHGGENPKGDLDLTGTLTKLYDRSYENLIEKGLLAHLNDGYGSANVAPEPPMTFGSHQSRLVDRIQKDPCKAKLSREEFIRIVTWVDSNAPYFGTHLGKKNLKWKDDPDFRPLPLAARSDSRR